MIAVFTTLEAAEGYVADVDAHEGYPRAGVPEVPYPFGWTLTWATPRKHWSSALWSVPAHADVPAVAASDLVESLDGWEEPL